MGDMRIEMEELLEEIKQAAYEVRMYMQAGYLEAVYKNALIVELTLRGLKVEAEVMIPVRYKGRMVGEYRADLVVNDAVILEVKAVRELSSMHEIQLVNYLTATGIEYGYLINYGGDVYRIIRKTRTYIPPVRRD